MAVRELTKLIGGLSSTTVAVLPPTVQYCQLQNQQIQELIQHKSFEGGSETLLGGQRGATFVERKSCFRTMENF